MMWLKAARRATSIEEQDSKITSISTNEIAPIENVAHTFGLEAQFIGKN